MTSKELGLNVDMIDVDRLHQIALELGDTGRPGMQAEGIRDLANRLTQEIKDVGTLRRRLTLVAIVEANLSRVEKWHSLESWSPLEWAGAMCGEAGEAANAAKKLKRVTDQIANEDGRLFGQQMSLGDQGALYRAQVIKEYADTLIYGVLLCASVGATPEEIEQTVRDVFNKKSEEYGFPERL